MNFDEAKSDRNLAERGFDFAHAARIMAIVRMTLEGARAKGRVDRSRTVSTTEVDIRRHAIEDGEDPDASLPDMVLSGPRERQEADRATSTGSDAPPVTGTKGDRGRNG